MERRHWHPKRPLRSAISFWCTDYQWEHHLRGWRRCQRSGTSVTQRQCHGERSVGAQRCQRAGPPDARLRDRHLARPRTWRRVFRRLASLAAIGAAERRYIGERSETLLPKDPVARAHATQWLIAALNSIEPSLMNVALIDLFYSNEE